MTRDRIDRKVQEESTLSMRHNCTPVSFLSIVVVNYNSGQQLEECLLAIQTFRPSVPFEIVVVDNHSTDGSCDFLKKNPYSNIRLVVNTKGMGYTHAANRGFALSKGDIVLFLNPDIKVLEHSIDNMIRHLEEDKSLGAVAGHFHFPDGRFHRYYNRFPTIISYYLTVFFSTRGASHLHSYRRYHMLDVDFSMPAEVPQPAGCCLMVRKEIFREGYMNPIFCIFFSDVDVCKKIYLAGKRIMVFPDCKVIHDHDYGSRSGNGLGYLFALDLYIGCANYFRIYSGFAAFLGVKVLFGGTLVLSLLLSCAKSILERNRWQEVRYKSRTLYYFFLHRNIIVDRP